MTLVTSWGGASDNAYVSMTVANSFITTSIIEFSDWSGASPQERGAALQQAARDIDARQYIGKRYYDSQRLEFPRAVRGFPWNNTTIQLSTSELQTRMKKDVEEASCIQAVWRLKYLASTHADRIAQGIESYSETVGPIKESAKYGGRAGIDNLSPGALKLLQPWMTGKKIFRG